MRGTGLDNDTICAVSTPAGVGGIAVIRISGPRAIQIAQKCWQGAPLASMKSHTAHLGRIIDPADGSVVDEVVTTVFLAPHSFTGEDTVEISCHGSLWIQQKIVTTLTDCGCRAAQAGEFTRRAFTNGRIDLSQAEAIADVIAASSRAAHRLAMSQMRGDFSRELSKLRERLLEFVSLMELELDFSEEEVEFADRQRLIALASQAEAVISGLADSFAVGNVIKNGMPVAIAGETNAGKSTLLNYLLRDDRALVSDSHGTTRDAIEGSIVIGGTLFRFIDTAGIRDTNDKIENLGIERSFQKISQARLVLWVIDGTSQPDAAAAVGRRVISRLNPAQDDGQRLIAAINKRDIITDQQAAQMRAELAALLPPGTPVVEISARECMGLDRLTRLIAQAAAIPDNDQGAVIVTNARHHQALVKAGQAIRRAIAGLRSGLSGDLVSQDIRETLHYLGEITGQITTSDILSNIFSHFCIGK